MKNRHNHYNKSDSDFHKAYIRKTLLLYYPEAKEFSMIASKGDIDALVECKPLLAEEFCRSIEDKAVHKPLLRPILHIAINFLDVDFVHFLLKEGANPNILNSYGQSTLEILLATMGAKIFNSYNNPKEIISNKKIGKAEKIFDLLLCFGLDHNKISWTPPFLKRLNKIKEDLDDIASQREEHYRLVTYICTISELSAHKNKSWVKRNIEVLENKLDIRTLEKEYKKYLSSDKYLQDWFQSTSTIFKTIEISSIKIQSEKKEFLTKVKHDIEESMNHPTLSIPFIFLILEYAHTEFDISMKIAEMRCKKNNKNNFWLTTEIDSFDTERYKNILKYAAILKNVLTIFEQVIFSPNTYNTDGLLETIAEYAMDDTSKTKKPGYHLH